MPRVVRAVLLGAGVRLLVTALVFVPTSVYALVTPYSSVVVPRTCARTAAHATAACRVEYVQHEHRGDRRRVGGRPFMSATLPFGGSRTVPACPARPG